MRRFFILLALFLVAVLGVARYATTRASDEDLKAEILKVSNEREEALATGDVAALDRIDADDIVYTNWRGVTLTKAQHQAVIKSKKLKFHTDFKHSDIKVVIHGDTGIVTGVSNTDVSYQGHPFHGTRKFVNVFVKQNGRWLCVVHFETPVAE